MRKSINLWSTGRQNPRPQNIFQKRAGCVSDTARKTRRQQTGRLGERIASAWISRRFPGIEFLAGNIGVGKVGEIDLLYIQRVQYSGITPAAISQGNWQSVVRYSRYQQKEIVSRERNQGFYVFEVRTRLCDCVIKALDNCSMCNSSPCLSLCRGTSSKGSTRCISPVCQNCEYSEFISKRKKSRVLRVAKVFKNNPWRYIENISVHRIGLKNKNTEQNLIENGSRVTSQNYTKSVPREIDEVRVFLLTVKINKADADRYLQSSQRAEGANLAGLLHGSKTVDPIRFGVGLYNLGLV